MLALGLMSGTSLDGIDAALIETDGKTVAHFGPALTLPYPEPVRTALRAAALGEGPVEPAEAEMTRLHAEAVARLLDQAGLGPDAIGVIGFHGHTLSHRPDQGHTHQIGDGAWLAATTGIRVVNDFRTADVAAGGQGAPLVPVFHRALATGIEAPLAVLNLGGVGNVTWIGEDGAMCAFDTGPGNALIDDWAQTHTGQPVDLDGALAAAGRVDLDRVAVFLSDPWFDLAPPKSLDRDDFARLAAKLTRGLSPADGAATLTAFTAAAVGAAQMHLPQPPRQWLITGGGRHNPVLMLALRQVLEVDVRPVETVGWNGDALEAQAFGFLAARVLAGLPTTFPSTTGVPEPLGGGRIFTP
ncbi:anhydro-N-acetylmuramic acid kinase [Magnetospirillum fulvum]|uniref:Anhydro-N-acetylmuramic acid kinase n=1 Tax=Magnetospirillum fulvum MGU-K5 TaxID=1316936 RepID=S9SB40_MAGFU|nr:anhydro-N-acetylmuramic acid kinase [Magnetospirillum fulvum]EPY01934.1 anhydro-N-acetylmuramic acid kinase [Magnetospirillum fulvum MGU-K5]